MNETRNNKHVFPRFGVPENMKNKTDNIPDTIKVKFGVALLKIIELVSVKNSLLFIFIYHTSALTLSKGLVNRVYSLTQGEALSINVPFWQWCHYFSRC